MGITPEDFLNVAKLIPSLPEKKCSREICFRTAINRYYYGILHWVQQRYGIVVPGTQIKQYHKYVKDEIRSREDIRDLILKEFDNLEKKRVDADYKIDQKINQSVLDDARKLQETIIQRVEQGVPFDIGDMWE